MKKSAKNVLITVLLVILTVALAACTNTDIETTLEIPTESTTAISTNTSAENTASENTDEVLEEGTIEKDGNVILKQLAFVYEDSIIALSDILDDEKIESMLGKADDIIVHTYTKDDGKNMTPLIGMTETQYYYPGLVIKTIDGTTDKKSFVFNIEITDPKYATVRNIKVGDSYETLKEAYPEGNLIGGELSDAEDDFRYEPVNYVDVMTFHIKDKKVESITIATLLD